MVDAQQFDKMKQLVFKAIRSKSAVPLEELLTNKGFPVDTVIMPLGVTPFLYCAAIGSADCLQKIINAGPEPAQVDTLGRNAFHYACKSGNLDTFKLLYDTYGEDEKMDLDAQSESGVTPLMAAIQSVEAELVVECLNKQANPFLVDGFGKTALHYANHMRAVNNVDFQGLITQAE